MPDPFKEIHFKLTATYFFSSLSCCDLSIYSTFRFCLTLSYACQSGNRLCVCTRARVRWTNDDSVTPNSSVYIAIELSARPKRHRKRLSSRHWSMERIFKSKETIHPSYISMCDKLCCNDVWLHSISIEKYIVYDHKCKSHLLKCVKPTDCGHTLMHFVISD